MDFFDILLAKKLGGGGGGEITVRSLNVTENGTYTAASGVAYSPVKVNVPQPSGTKEINITQNGTTVEDINDYSSAQITVAVPQPSGSVNITQNGSVDVTDYETAVVNVQPALQTKQATQNGDVTPDAGYYGLSKVEVNVPQPSGTINITQNGTVDVSAYASASVAVPQGAVGVQSDVIAPTSGDISGEYTITVDGLPDFFTVVAEADMTAQNAYLQSMYAIRDANNTGAAAPYSGIRGSTSALSYFGANSTATINFTTNAIIVTFSPSLTKLKSGVVYRWFAWSVQNGGGA